MLFPPSVLLCALDLQCSFSKLFIFKVWVVGDGTAGAELHPSKQLHTASKHSMCGGCRATGIKVREITFG